MTEVKHLKPSSVVNVQSYRTNCDSAHTGSRYALELNREKEGGKQCPDLKLSSN